MSSFPFSGSRFSQSTAISLGLNAGFIGWEMLAAGRIASGEEFAFDFFHSECSDLLRNPPARTGALFFDSRPQAIRGLLLDGAGFATQPLCISAIPGIAQPRWIDLESRLNDLAFGQTFLRGTLGREHPGCGGPCSSRPCARSTSHHSRPYTFWNLAKQELWGEPAVPPRKIN